MIKKSKTPKDISAPEELITPEDHNNKKKYTAKEKKEKQKKEDKDKRLGLKVPKTVQDTIPYKSMYENGICEIEDGIFSRSYLLEDVNFKIATPEEQESIHKPGFLSNKASQYRRYP